MEAKINSKCNPSAIGESLYLGGWVCSAYV